jgi:translocation and assembly module TamB
MTAIVGPLALIWSALYTEAGIRFVVRHIPRHVGPVTLEISGVSGTVARGLHVERVEVTHELVYLRFENISGQMTLSPLVLQTIRVRSGSVGSALVEVRRRVHPSTPGPPSPFLPSWLLISAEQAHVEHATLTVFNGFRMEVSNINGSAVVHHRDIRLFQAEAELFGAHVNGDGDVLAADPLGMHFEGHVDWQPEGQPRWTIDGNADGDLNTLSIVSRVVAPFRADVSGQLQDLTGGWHWVGDATVQDFDLRAWGISGPLGSITGHLAMAGNGEGFGGHGPLNPTGLKAGDFEVQFQGGWAEHTLTAKHMEARHLSSGAHAVGAGTIEVVEHGPRLDLRGRWDGFRWPLVGREVAVRSAAGTFALQGILPYKVHVSGRMRAAELPEMPVEVVGTLDKDSFAFAPGEVDLYGGHATVTGRVTWSPEDTWAASGHVSELNPGELRPDLPGSVSFNFAASGRGFDTKGDLTASFSDLAGRLRRESVTGSGTITHLGTTWGFNTVRVGLGTARLALDGRLSERMDLRFALSTQDLSVLAAGSKGQIKASGSLAGTFGDPVIALSAHGSNVDFQGVTVKSFDADVDFDPAALDKESKIDARVHALAFQGRTLDAATFTLSGPPSAYVAQLTASAPGIAAQVQARGAYAHMSFKGQLTALTLSGNDSLHLTLDRPVELALSPEHARIEWLCLNGTPGAVCADGDWAPDAWSTTVMTNELPLATLTAGRTPAVQYLGMISALVRLSGGVTTPLQGTVRVQLTDAEIAHRLASKKIERTLIGSGTVSVAATPTLINAQAMLGGGQVGTLKAQLDIQRSTPRWQDFPLSGELHAHGADIELVSLYVPQIDRASGEINVDAQLAGTVGMPQLAGLFKVSDGEIDVYQINLALKQVNAEARLTQAGIDFKGSAAAGAGSLSASGHLEWHNLQPYGEFKLAGSNLRVADIPEVQIDASPDLDFTVTGRKIEIKGKVLVPYAKIAPTDITNQVRTSDDEIIIGAEQDDPSKRLEVLSDITLTLGDKVSVDTLGLTARLTGSINLKSGYDAVTRGSGELSVADGKYMAYGRKLDIRTGRLIFSGGPVDNPGIDVVAVKVFEDVTAGINVRGTLLQPRMSFWSDPPLPQSQVVQLILAGGSFETAQNRSAGSAALAQGVAMFGQQYGSMVGIEDVSLESDINNETSLVLGRYLSPRLYVSYGVSLTEQLNTLKMRYTLGDHWTIKIEAGQAQGADLVYSITK